MYIYIYLYFIHILGYIFKQKLRASIPFESNFNANVTTGTVIYIIVIIPILDQYNVERDHRRLLASLHRSLAT